MDTMRPLCRATAAAVLGALALGLAGPAMAADPFVSSHPAFWAPFVLVGDGG